MYSIVGLGKLLDKQVALRLLPHTDKVKGLRLTRHQVTVHPVRGLSLKLGRPYSNERNKAKAPGAGELGPRI